MRAAAEAAKAKAAGSHSGLRFTADGRRPLVRMDNDLLWDQIQERDEELAPEKLSAETARCDGGVAHSRAPSPHRARPQCRAGAAACALAGRVPPPA